MAASVWFEAVRDSAGVDGLYNRYQKLCATG